MNVLPAKGKWGNEKDFAFSVCKIFFLAFGDLGVLK